MTVGVDLTESTIRAVVVDGDGTVVGRATHALGKGGLGTAVREAVRAARSRAGNSATLAMGIAVPEPGDGLPPEVVDAIAISSSGALATIGAGPAIAIAEAWCGVARGTRDLVAFFLGEHVAAGALVSGEPLRGAHRAAGSVRWLAVNPVERDDYRRYGALEAEISAVGIVRRLVWRIKSGDQSRVAEQVGGDLSRITAAQIIDAARTGDGVSISVVRDTVKYVAMAVSNLATMLDPECVVLGGTLASCGDIMLEPIRLECTRRLRPTQSARLRILLSTLDEDAAAIGAARVASLQLR